MDASGYPVSDGVYTVRFSIYDSATGGTRLWTASGTTAVPTPLNISVQNGLFTVLLGDTSSSGGSQNTLDSVNWNQDNLYLGVTIGADAEMMPRKRLGAAPQAFNSRQLQGMYASSTALSGESLFRIHQTAANAATSTRTALEVRSAGTSNANDFLIRAIDNVGNAVFSINRQGNVTSTGYLTVTGASTSTFSHAVSSTRGEFSLGLTVGGRHVCLEDGTNCTASAEADTLASVSNRGNFATTSLLFYGGATASTLTVTSTLTANGNVILGDASSDTITFNGRIASDLIASTDLAYSLGSGLFRFQNAWFGGTVTSTNFKADVSTSTFVTKATHPVGNGPYHLHVVDNYAYIANSLDDTLSIVDVSQPGNPVTVTTTSVGDAPDAVFVSDGYAFVGNQADNTISILDVRNPGAPTTVSTYAVPTGPISLVVDGRYLYVTGYFVDNFSIIDISDPVNPVTVNTHTVGDFPRAINVRDGFVYVTNEGDDTLSIVDARNPLSLVTVTTTATGDQPRSAFIEDDHIFITDRGDSTLSIFNIQDPSNPVLVATHPVGTTPFYVSVAGRYAYVVNNADDAVSVIDVIDPSNPVDVATFAVGDSPFSLAIAGRHLYVANNIGDSLSIIEIGGITTNGLYADAAGIGSLAVYGSGSIAERLFVGQSVSVGRGGIFSVGGISVADRFATSTFLGAVSTSRLLVNGQRVCLEDGTNCPPGGSGSSNWLYTSAGNFYRPVTSTGNIVIGGTSTTVSHMNSQFALNGGDLYVSGNIGSASSIYTNGEFVAGPGSTHYGDGYINKTNGTLTLSSTNHLLLNPSNNVGIGTTSPSEKFTLVGNMRNVLETGQSFSAVTTTAAQTGPYSVYTKDNFLYVTNYLEDTLSIFDVTTPESPEIVTTTATGLGPISVQVSGNYAYVANEGDDDVSIYDVTNPKAPIAIATHPAGDFPQSLFVQGNFVYVANNIGAPGLSIIDVSDPSNPVTAATANAGVEPFSVYVSGQYAYVANSGSNTVSIFNISDPYNPTLVSSPSTGAVPLSVFVQGRYAYVANFTGDTVSIIDISDPANPVTVSTPAAGNTPHFVRGNGRYIYVANRDDAEITTIDVHDPTNPVVIGTTAVPGDPYALHVSGRYLYVPNLDNDSITILDVTGIETNGLIAAGARVGNLDVWGRSQFGEDVEIRGGLTVGTGGIFSDGTLAVYAPNGTSTIRSALEITGLASTTRLLVGGRRVCLEDGTNCAVASETDTLASVSNRGNFATTSLLFYGGATASTLTVTSTLTANGNVILGDASTDTITFNGRVASDLLPDTDLAYSLGSGALRWNGNFGSVTSTNVFISDALTFTSATGNSLGLDIENPVAVGNFNTTGTAMDVFVSKGYAYVADLGQGLQIFNVNDPSNPIFVTGTTSGANEAWQVVVHGDYAYVAFENGGLRIYDVSNPEAPSFVGDYDGGACRAIGVYVVGRYAYLGCDANGFRIVDVSNPANPVLVSNLAFTATNSVFVQGSYAYAADGASGLRIVDVSDPTNPVNTATFNTTGTAIGVTAFGKYAYVADGTGGLVIVDISDPTNPQFVTDLLSGAAVAWSVELAGRYAFLGHFASGLRIVDVSDPTNPTLAATYTNGANLVRGAFVSGKYAYVPVSAAGLDIVNLGGADFGAARIGALEAGRANVLTDLIVGNSAYFGNGATFGFGGLLSRGPLAVTGFNVTSTFLGAVSTSRLLVNGQRVCLEDGTNCPPGGSGSSNWLYTSAGNFYRPVTSTGNIVIGGTSTTVSHMNSQFALNGGDLYVSGNIGSASSIYTNGEFVAGPGSTHYGDGYINKTNGTFDISATGTISLNVSSTLIGSFGYDGIILQTRQKASGAGGDVLVSTGNGTGALSAAGGKFTVFTGSGTGSASGGDISFTGGISGLGGFGGFRGGSINLTGGNGAVSSGNGGGLINITGGNGSTGFPGVGGDVNISGGVGGGQFGGSVFITGGNDTGGGSGGNIFLRAGNETSFGNGGGRIEIRPGSSTAPYILIDNESDTAGATTQLRFKELDSAPGFGEYVAFKAADNIVTTTIWTLPFEDGGASYALTTNGSGVLGFASVCLTDGTNCPPGGSGSSNWLYTSAGNFYRPVTSTGNIVIGGTSTTVSHMNSQFALNGGDLYVSGNIGSASSIYTNGAFVAGPGSTSFGNGFISNSTGQLRISSPSGTRVNGAFNQTFGSDSPFTFRGSTTIGDESYSVDVRGRYAYVTDAVAGEFRIIDIANPDSPRVVRTITGLGGPENAYIDGRYAYVPSNSQLNVINIQDPASAAVVATLAGLTGAYDVVGYGSLLYISSGFSGGTFYVVDISNPLSPSLVRTVNVSGGGLFGMDIAGSYLYTANGSNNTMTTFNLANPTSPVAVATTTGLNFPVQIETQDAFAYVISQGNSTFSIVDVSNAATPTIARTLSGFSDPAVLRVAGRYAYLSSFGTSNVDIVDIQSTTTASIVRSIAFPSGFPIGIDIAGRYLYAGFSGLDQFQVVDLNGMETFALSAHSLEAGDVRVLGEASFLRGVNVLGGAMIDGGLLLNGALAVGGTNVTSSFAGALTVGDLRVGGQLVCLADGTNCPTGGSSSNWIYTSVNNFYRPATSTGNVVIGGTSTTVSHMNAQFALNGGDLYVSGNIGSASSVYTNGEFVVGPASAHYGDGYINQTAGNFTLNIAGGSLLPATDLGISLGSSAQKFNAYLGNVTTTGNLVLGDNSSDLITINGSVTSDILPPFNEVHSLGTGSFFRWDAYLRNATATKLSVLSGGISSLPSTTGNSGDATMLGNSATLNQTVNLIEKNRRLYHVSPQGQLQILDVTNPSNPFLAVSTVLNAATTPTDFDIEDDVLVVAGESATAGFYGIQLYSLTNPSSPLAFGEALLTSGSGLEVEVSGRYAYVTSQVSSTLYIVDISDPSDISVEATVPFLGTPTDVKVHDNLAYVTDAGGNNLFTIGLFDGLASPAIVATTSLPQVPADVVIQGRYAYVSYSNVTQYSIIDINNTTAPVIVNTLTCTGTTCTGSMIAGDYLIQKGYVPLSQSRTVRFLDITSSSTPTTVANLALDIPDLNVEFMARSGSYIFLQLRRVPFGAPTSTVYVIDTGGIKTEAVKTASLETGELSVRTDANIFEDLTVGGALRAENGFYSFGPGSVAALTDRSAFQAVNLKNSSGGRTWGAFINRLLVGSESAATGTNNYNMVLTYAGAANIGGLCLDSSTSAAQCPTTGINGASILADGAITSDAFDLAEVYDVNGPSAPGDVLVLDSTATGTVTVSSGIPYDRRVIGIVSTDPGFVLGWNDGAKVALSGRVPTKVNVTNGAIAVGDPLTSSGVPGQAMKATKPGMILGYALDNASATGTIEMFVDVGYWAGDILKTDGTISVLADDLTVAPVESASASSTLVNSWGLTFRGEAWDSVGSSAVQQSFTLQTNILSTTSSEFTIRNTSGTSVFTVNQNGDVSIAGRLYPSDEGNPQNEYYIFKTEVLSLPYIGTNAFGWQAGTSYDLAEFYYSIDALEPGDIVMTSLDGELGVELAKQDQMPLLGVVSSKPGFILGRHATDTYPIALAGRVPTKVSSEGGAIAIGDRIAVSSEGGVGMKYQGQGNYVGIALEAYDGAGEGVIEVFINPGWNPGAVAASGGSGQGAVQQGFAVIAAGATNVSVSFPSIGAYPNVQATPQTQAGEWWTSNYTDTGFEIHLGAVLERDVMFSWSVQPLSSGSRLYSSDGTHVELDSLTGEAVPEEPSDP